jgi:subtilisin family serine protease
MKLTSGSPKISIGLVDGPVSINHSSISNKNIYELPGKLTGSCTIADSVACNHGTFVAGILKAKIGSIAPAICPDCTLILRSVFSEKTIDDTIPNASPQELANAIVDCVKAGVNIINLSLAIATPTIKAEAELEKAISYAANRQVIIVASAGNQGTVGSTSITRHPWVIPVIACNNMGHPLQMSNICHSIGRNGLSAPGENITSLGGKNNLVEYTGTSAATPFVTGIIALLWSLYPNLSGAFIKNAVMSLNNRKSIIPPLVNAKIAYEYLYSKNLQKATA